MNTASIERLPQFDYIILHIVNMLSPASTIHIILSVFLSANGKCRVVLAAISRINVAFSLLDKRRVCSRLRTIKDNIFSRNVPHLIVCRKQRSGHFLTDFCYLCIGHQASSVAIKDFRVWHKRKSIVPVPRSSSVEYASASVNDVPQLLIDQLRAVTLCL